MLSLENKKKININGLYRHKPDRKMRSRIYSNNLYHCMNWTFTVEEQKDGSLVMVDTYWSICSSENSYVVTDENVNEWEFIFDRKKVRKISSYEAQEYEEKDVFHEAVDSGGMYCGGTWFVKKDAKPSKQKKINRVQNEINSLLQKLKWKEEELKRIKEEE